MQIGSKWSETTQTGTGKVITNYTFAAETDSTYVIEFTAEAVDNVVSQMMGQQAVSKINSNTKGQISVDKKSGIIRERTSETSSHGTVEAMNTSMPITGKMTLKTVVTIE